MGPSLSRLQLFTISKNIFLHNSSFRTVGNVEKIRYWGGPATAKICGFDQIRGGLSASLAGRGLFGGKVEGFQSLLLPLARRSLQGKWRVGDRGILGLDLFGMIDKTEELSGPHGMLQLSHRFGLDLPHPFPSYGEDFPDLF